MNNSVLVGLREFRQRIRTRGFLLTTLAVPLILIVVMLVSGLRGAGGPEAPPLQGISEAETADRSLGFVDQAELIESIPPEVPAGLFQEYAQVEAAEAALAEGEIDAYYLVPPEYRQDGQLQRVSPRLPIATSDTRLFDWILVNNMFPDESSEQVALYYWPFGQAGPNHIPLSAEGEEGGGSANPTMPFIVVMAMMLPLFTSGGFLLQSLTQEKSNRVMEILLVSLQPRQLLTGKLLGLGALTVVQYLGWLLIGASVVLATGGDVVQTLATISLTPAELGLAALFALGGFTLYAAVMAGIGAMAPDMEGSRTWVFIISLPMMIPLYLWPSIVGVPSGPLAVTLSLIPFSAPIAMLMRLTSVAVPPWQLAVSLALLLLASVVTLWLMGRLFRVQTLLSGESLSLRRLWSTLWS